MKTLPFLNSCHQVQGLINAHWVTDEGKKPWAGKTSLKGSKAAGKRLEKEIALAIAVKGLPEGLDRQIYNPWIEFWDSTGHHFAQPDFVLIGPKTIVVLEVKLSQSPFAFDQLVYLYKPLLEKMYPGREILLLQICKVMKCQWEPICWSLEDGIALARDSSKNIPIIHFQGSI